MTFEVEINGRIRSITIDPVGAAGPTGGRFRVSVRDAADVDRAHDAGPATGPVTPVELDVRPTDLGLSILFVDGPRTVDAALTDRGGGDVFVQLPHVGLTASVDGRRFRRGGADQGSRAGLVRVLAPMPGRVVRVLVQPGDAVTARQGVVVVEAMKMENELASPKDGRVKEIGVEAGQSVEAGRLLVVIE